MISRIATFRPSKSDDAIVIVIDGKTVKLSQAVAANKTGEQVETALNAAAALSDVQLPDLFVHVNLDNSLALATGHAPALWPEDEKE